MGSPFKIANEGFYACDLAGDQKGSAQSASSSLSPAALTNTSLCQREGGDGRESLVTHQLGGEGDNSNLCSLLQKMGLHLSKPSY